MPKTFAIVPADGSGIRMGSAKPKQFLDLAGRAIEAVGKVGGPTPAVIDALIEVLHKAQELFGYLEDDVLLFVAHHLKLPPSRVYGVATFYHFFTLKPQGEHTCVVCMGTACYVKGADKVVEAIEKFAKIKPGETTPDNKLSLLTARCIGACGIAPAVVYDGAVTPRQTPETALEKINKWVKK